nr:hypothetical protein CFP56_63782 [Quercus suber]
MLVPGNECRVWDHARRRTGRKDVQRVLALQIVGSDVKRNRSSVLLTRFSARCDARGLLAMFLREASESAEIKWPIRPSRARWICTGRSTESRAC